MEEEVEDFSNDTQEGRGGEEAFVHKGRILGTPLNAVCRVKEEWVVEALG